MLRNVRVAAAQQKCTACGSSMWPEISWSCSACPYSERGKGKGKSCETGTLRYPQPLTAYLHHEEDEGRVPGGNELYRRYEDCIANEDMEEIGYYSDSSGQACQMARAMGAF